MLSNTPEGHPSSDSPSTPPSVRPTPQAPGLVTNEAKQAVPPSAPQRFSQEILPAVTAIQVSCLTDPAAANIAPLAQILGQSEKRSLVWDTLEQCGMPKSLTPPQQHALMTLLIPYVSQDGERCWKGLYRAVHDVVQECDYPLYEALGHAISKEHLPAPVLFSLAEPFCDLSTHNAKNERAFAPWVDLFAGRGDGPVCLFMMERMLGRIGAGELSSYDHLLSVLCKTENPVASALLLKSLSPQQEIPPSTVLLPSPGLALSFQLFETVRMAPAAVLLSFAVSGIEGIASLQTAIGALALGALSAVLRWNSLKSQLRHISSEEFEVFKRRPFQHYAERVYRKLSEANGGSETSQKILSALEGNSLYHDILSRCRQKAAPAS